jgi:ParB family transcriptional regulator, chromosome partitioning protein
MTTEQTKAAAKPATKTTATAKPRASFAAASFGNLRAAAGEGQGEALRILLADIDEDPNQPRQTFDQGELEAMAESIREHGVVQPIVVRPPVDGRYMLVAGARRFRASKLAGVRDIPATIRNGGADDFAAQVIENQQRANLSNSELADAIAKLSEQGRTNKQIGSICNLKDYQVAAFRQAPNFPRELAERINSGDMRALYDLYRQWQKTPADVIAALPPADTFITITEARRIIGEISGKPTGSIVLDRAKDPASAQPAEPVQESGQEVPANLSAVAAPAPSSPPAPQASEDKLEAAPTLRPAEPQASAPKASGVPVFIVAAGDGQTGRLVVDQRAERPGSALVAYATGVEEVDTSELRIVRIE